MRLGDFDVDVTDGSKPLATALLWLRTLINAPNVPWHPDQRAHAQSVHDRAMHVLSAEVEVSTADGEKVTVASVCARPEGLH